MYIVLFITFNFACMTKVLLIYEIHGFFKARHIDFMTFPVLVELPTLYSVCTICCRMLEYWYHCIGTNGITNMVPLIKP